nr:hypothetical protein [Pseudomonadota bacterium]
MSATAAEIANSAIAEQPPARPRRPYGQRKTLSLANWVIIALGAIFFFVPLIMTGIFSLWQGGNRYGFSAYDLMLHTAGFWNSLFLSLRLGVETIVLTFVLLVPAMIFVHLKVPRLKPLFEFIS